MASVKAAALSVEEAAKIARARIAGPDEAKAIANREEGRELGISWAARCASGDHLRALVEWADRTQDIEDDLDPEHNSAYSPAERLAFYVEPEYDGNRHAASDLMIEALGDDWSELEKRPGLLLGFAEGALEVARSV